jgi:uncharacterized glyoxalase superfamily protein PhnB
MVELKPALLVFSAWWLTGTPISLRRLLRATSGWTRPPPSNKIKIFAPARRVTKAERETDDDFSQWTAAAEHLGEHRQRRRACACEVGTRDGLRGGSVPSRRARGAIHHCQLDWPEGGRIMLSSTGERPTPCRPGTASLHVVTADPDAVMSRARTLRAPIVHDMTDQEDYPSRDFTVADPDGNHWTFSTFAG